MAASDSSGNFVSTLEPQSSIANDKGLLTGDTTRIGNMSSIVPLKNDEDSGVDQLKALLETKNDVLDNKVSKKITFSPTPWMLIKKYDRNEDSTYKENT